MKKFRAISLITMAALLLGGIFASPASAQFIGYSSPQTVNQKVFGAQTTAAVSPASSPFPCTAINGTPCGIPNLGQSIHSVTYTIANPCTTGFFMDMRIEATNDGSTWFAISEDATDQNSGLVQGSSVGGLTAVGSYAGYRLNLVSIACSSGQVPAITAFYSGTSTSNPTNVGAFYQSSPYRKVIIQNLATTAAGATPAVTINAPNGNTAGALYVSCFIAASGATTSCPAAMTVTVTGFIAFGSSIGGGGGGNIAAGTNIYGINPTVLPVTQIFSVPAVSMTFSFGGAGTAGVNWSIYYFSNSTPTSSFVADPCASSGSVKKSVFLNITTGSTTGLVLGVVQQTVFVCEFDFNMVATTAADTVKLVQGAGASCTTPSDISPTYSSGVMTNGSLTSTIGNAGATVYAAVTGQSVCATTAVGTGPTIAVHIVYVQQ
jgi:hypothetical protein